MCMVSELFQTDYYVIVLYYGAFLYYKLFGYWHDIFFILQSDLYLNNCKKLELMIIITLHRLFPRYPMIADYPQCFNTTIYLTFFIEDCIKSLLVLLIHPRYIVMLAKFNRCM